jgi:sucrose-6-phosphate hydrolase SacC (GH32 family)
VRLLVGNDTVRSATGSDTERLAWRSWDVRDLRGKKARLEITDLATGGWGHLNADHFVLADQSARNATEAALWADYGRDFYAAVSWSDVPKRDGRRLWIGWMSNWNYANDVPTRPWRSAMTVPRELTLVDTPAGYRLRQRPVRELAKLRGPARSLKRSGIREVNAWLAGRTWTNGLAELEVHLKTVPTAGVLTLRCQHGIRDETRLQADFGAGQLRIDRTRSGRSDFSPTFAGVHSGPLRVTQGGLSLTVLVDVSSFEVFAQGGETVLTDLVLPETNDLRFAFEYDGDASGILIDSLVVRPLKTAPPSFPRSKP